MSANVIPFRCASKSVVYLARQQLKSLSGEVRGVHAGQPVSSAVSAATATSDDAGVVKSYEEIPGPKPLPGVGNIWRFLPIIGEYAGLELDDFHRLIYRQYGPLVRLTGVPGRRDTVFAYRPEDMEVTYRNEGPWPIREGLQALDHYRTVHRKNFYEGGGSVVTENGPKWLETRSKVNQPMMQPRISKRYAPHINSVAQEFVNRMRAMRDGKDELPPHFINELFKWALESIACVALDTRLGCLAPNLAPDSEPQKLIDAAQVVFEGLFQMEIALPLWKIYPTQEWKKLVKGLDMFLEVSVKYVRASIERMERRKGRNQDGEGEPSVLERLLARTDEKTASIMAQDMLLGGIDTTSYSTASVMYMLAKNQDKQEELFKEVKRLLPHKDSAVSEENREEMRFLKAIFKETMRMSPLVVGGMRKTVKDVVLSNYKVPEGVNVLMSNVMFRTNEDIYPQAKRFLPERWLKARPDGAERVGSAEDFDAVSHGKHHPFAFLPFGFGVRMCVGKRFAEMEMEILVAKLVRNFRVEYLYGEVTMASRLINMIKDPLKFKLTERSE
ncbi:probable cytochrome P450 49a1 [Ischnura elegans]|uniref:probable cytochrome P450 49a1 n=1 Tax=Ischnura elegans TaxID=197161 RepID=UPI001ED89653|nr:probable cytochrome P450 49a1 [Ischnura elegans]